MNCIGPRARARVPVLVVSLVLLFGLVGGCRSSESADRAAVRDGLGLPTCTDCHLRVLENIGFTLGYDERHDRPLWAMYRAERPGPYRDLPRPAYAPDPRLPGASAVHGAGRRGWDHGHLAPNYAISQRHGPEAQRQTFYHSNLVAQRSRHNQLAWQRLEEIEIDALAGRVGGLWVVLGPVYADNSRIPAGFFRVWVARDGDQWQAVGFMLPQRLRGDERLGDFIVSIDAIEAATGLDLMAALAVSQQNAIEAVPASSTTLGFDAHQCAPARYADRWQGRDGIRLRFDRCGR